MTVMFYMQQGYDFFQDVAITNWIFFCFVFFVHVCYVFFLNTHKLFKLDKLRLVKSPWVHGGEEVMDANRILSTSSSEHIQRNQQHYHPRLFCPITVH